MKQQQKKQLPKAEEISPAEELDAFLSFLRKASADYKMCNSIINDEDNATQDLLHYLELENVSYHEFAKLSKTTKAVRQERRNAKHTMELLEPIIQWINSNGPTIKKLEETLGLMRKVEKSIGNRRYNYKTSVINDTLNINKAYS